MCNVIILFLLFCNGGCGFGCGNGCGNRSCGSSCGCGDDRSSCGNSCGCSGDRPSCGSSRERDNDRPSCGCERDRSMASCGNDDNQGCDSARDNSSSLTPPPWVQSNYANGDSCSCSER